LHANQRKRLHVKTWGRFFVAGAQARALLPVIFALGEPTAGQVPGRRAHRPEPRSSELFFPAAFLEKRKGICYSEANSKALYKVREEAAWSI
jgi:hypothetical protein